MILDLLLGIPILLLQALLGVLPSGSLPSSISSSFSTMVGYLAEWKSFFPVDTLLAVVSWAVTFQLALWGTEFAIWMYGRVRGVSNK